MLGLGGESVLGIEDGAADLMHEAPDLSVGAAVRRGSVVLRGVQPVGLGPDVEESLAGPVSDNDGVVPVLHGFLGDHNAKLWWCFAERPRNLLQL